MKNNKMKTLIGLGVAITFVAPFSYADSLKDNEVARTKDGNPVTLKKDGTCVRISDEAGMNFCGKSILSQAEKEVLFEFDSAELTSSTKIALSKVAHKLRKADHVKSATIVGHADKIGSEEYNIELSQKRAQAVQDFLAQNGYLNTNITVVEAVGERYSNTDCSNADGFSQKVECLHEDRKVEISVNYETTPQYSMLDK